MSDKAHCVICKSMLVQQWESRKLGERRSLMNTSVIDQMQNILVGYYCHECGLSYKKAPKPKTEATFN